jgi:hypothetical protein
MAIYGTIEKDGTVTVTWNSQADKLEATQSGLHYLPCEICGVLQQVTWDIVVATCDRCVHILSQYYELDGQEVEVVEFMRQLEAGGDRQKALALKVGESMNLGGGAAPLMVLRRVS